MDHSGTFSSLSPYPSLWECSSDAGRFPHTSFRRPSALHDEAQRYDVGMTKSKIAISLPKDQIAWVHREVRAGRAASVSGYIARVLAEQERRESLRELLKDLIEQHGEPSAKDFKWAQRALEQRRG